jgi:hypothetical protein
MPSSIAPFSSSGVTGVRDYSVSTDPGLNQQVKDAAQASPQLLRPVDPRVYGDTGGGGGGSGSGGGPTGGNYNPQTQPGTGYGTQAMPEFQRLLAPVPTPVKAPITAPIAAPEAAPVKAPEAAPATEAASPAPAGPAAPAPPTASPVVFSTTALPALQTLQRDAPSTPASSSTFSTAQMFSNSSLSGSTGLRASSGAGSGSAAIAEVAARLGTSGYPASSYGLQPVKVAGTLTNGLTWIYHQVVPPAVRRVAAPVVQPVKRKVQQVDGVIESGKKAIQNAVDGTAPGGAPKQGVNSSSRSRPQQPSWTPSISKSGASNWGSSPRAQQLLRQNGIPAKQTITPPPPVPGKLTVGGESLAVKIDPMSKKIVSDSAGRLPYAMTAKQYASYAQSKAPKNERYLTNADGVRLRLRDTAAGGIEVSAPGYATRTLSSATSNAAIKASDYFAPTKAVGPLTVQGTRFQINRQTAAGGGAATYSTTVRMADGSNRVVTATSVDQLKGRLDRALGPPVGDVIDPTADPFAPKRKDTADFGQKVDLGGLNALLNVYRPVAGLLDLAGFPGPLSTVKDRQWELNNRATVLGIRNDDGIVSASNLGVNATMIFGTGASTAVLKGPAIVRTGLALFALPVATRVGQDNSNGTLGVGTAANAVKDVAVGALTSKLGGGSLVRQTAVSTVGQTARGALEGQKITPSGVFENVLLNAAGSAGFKTGHNASQTPARASSQSDVAPRARPTAGQPQPQSTGQSRALTTRSSPSTDSALTTSASSPKARTGPGGKQSGSTPKAGTGASTSTSTKTASGGRSSLQAQTPTAAAVQDARPTRSLPALTGGFVAKPGDLERLYAQSPASGSTTAKQLAPTNNAPIRLTFNGKDVGTNYTGNNGSLTITRGPTNTVVSAGPNYFGATMMQGGSAPSRATLSQAIDGTPLLTDSTGAVQPLSGATLQYDPDTNRTYLIGRDSRLNELDPGNYRAVYDAQANRTLISIPGRIPGKPLNSAPNAQSLVDFGAGNNTTGRRLVEATKLPQYPNAVGAFPNPLDGNHVAATRDRYLNAAEGEKRIIGNYPAYNPQDVAISTGVLSNVGAPLDLYAQRISNQRADVSTRAVNAFVNTAAGRTLLNKLFGTQNMEFEVKETGVRAQSTGPFGQNRFFWNFLDFKTGRADGLSLGTIADVASRGGRGKLGNYLDSSATDQILSTLLTSATGFDLSADRTHFYEFSLRRNRSEAGGTGAIVADLDPNPATRSPSGWKVNASFDAPTGEYVLMRNLEVKANSQVEGGSGPLTARTVNYLGGHGGYGLIPAGTRFNTREMAAIEWGIRNPANFYRSGNANRAGNAEPLFRFWEVNGFTQARARLNFLRHIQFPQASDNSRLLRVDFGVTTALPVPQYSAEGGLVVKVIARPLTQSVQPPRP